MWTLRYKRWNSPSRSVVQWCYSYINITSSVGRGDTHMVRHPRCVIINYNWINQLSNTTIWWLGIYVVYYIGINYVFRLLWPSSGWQIDYKLVSSYTLACVLCMVEGGLGLDGGTRSGVCWVGRVMRVHGYYCAVHGHYCAGLSLCRLRLW
jgi:hypothetical protein